MVITRHARFRRGATRRPFPFTFPFTAICAAALCLLVVAAVAACAAGGGGAAGERFEQGRPPEWFQQRHERVLRDFFGYQVRVAQRREQVVRAVEANTDRWWLGERRRLTARERGIERNEAIELGFFRLQTRGEQARGREEMVDARVQQQLFAAQARSQRELQRREAERERVRQQLLRRDSLGRQQQARREARSRRAFQRATNGRRAVAPGQRLGAARVAPGQRAGVAPFTSAQPAAAAPRPAF